MNLLLDSHVLLWAMKFPEKLSRPAREALENGDNAVFFSPASIWELCIKSSKGRLDIDEGFLDAIALTAFIELPIRATHAWEVKAMPRHHGDLFDRLLVAQAKAQNLTLVSNDKVLEQYGISVLPA